MIKLLFICKKKNDSYGNSYGLVNSARFVCNALKKFKIEAETEVAIDGNCIDAIIHKHKPSHVFLEALWVTPDKLKELMSLPKYGHIQWYIRIHSKIAFIANEGIAVQWLREYSGLTHIFNNLTLVANSPEIIIDFKRRLG
jgi:hypothetical protein